MTSNELFLTLTSYEDFDKNREKLRDLQWNDEIRQHAKKILTVKRAANPNLHEDYFIKKEK